jgi:diguanylate cyclase (GGDEF)-like protein
MRGEIARLAWPGRATGALERRRAAAIVRRIRGFALLFAFLTVAWIAVDVAVFPAAVWKPLAIIRLLTSFALLALARACRGEVAGRPGARMRLAALYAIPTIFFLATLGFVGDAPPDRLSQGVAAAYTFVPLMLAAGVAAFPLAAVECLVVAAFTLALEAAALAWGSLPLVPRAFGESLWLHGLIALVASFSSVSQLELMDALVRQAVRDPLTACLRRDSGEELLSLQVRIAMRKGAPLAVLFADIDRFKDVNDRFGHDAGDQVLASTASALGRILRASDILVRWGGEEFVVALPDTTGAEAAMLLERLREGGVGAKPDGSAVTLSVGIAEWHEDGAPTAQALVELADRRMYAAKQAGRNRYLGRSGQARLLLPQPAG